MIEIRALEGGRFEVYAGERHCEAFEGSLGAIAVAHALASGIAAETHQTVTIAAPWGECAVTEPHAGA